MEIDITKWNRISETAFNGFGYDSGILVKNFDPTNFTEPADEDIICTTTGNITASMVPTMVDLGEDVNGLHGQFSELQLLERWVATMGFTALEITPESIKFALAAADIDGNGVKARTYLKQSDFVKNVALIMSRLDGGLTAAVMNLGLSTGGVSLTTSKSGKVNSAVTLTGYQTMKKQSEMAMSFYATEGAEEVGVPEIVLDRSNVSVVENGTAKINASVMPYGAAVTWTSSNDEVATVSGGVVTGVAAGTATITAKITVDETDYTDTCTVTVTAAGV